MSGAEDRATVVVCVVAGALLLVLGYAIGGIIEMNYAATVARLMGHADVAAEILGQKR